MLIVVVATSIGGENSPTVHLRRRPVPPPLPLRPARGAPPGAPLQGAGDVGGPRGGCRGVVPGQQGLRGGMYPTTVMFRAIRIQVIWRRNKLQRPATPPLSAFY